MADCKAQKACAKEEPHIVNTECKLKIAEGKQGVEELNKNKG